MATKKTGSKAPAKKPALKGGIIDMTKGAKTVIPESFYHPVKDKGRHKGIPDD